MTQEQHMALVEVLLAIEGMAILSGYRHEVYAPLEAAGWRLYEFAAKCSPLAAVPETS